MKKKLLVALIAVAVAVSFVPATVFATPTSTSITGKTISLAHYAYIYNGAQRTPAVTIKGLKKNRDFKVTYTSNKRVGTATATITGINKYRGTVKKTFVIKPRPVAMTGLSKGASSMTVRWNSYFLGDVKNDFTGYLIKYSTRSDMVGASVVKVAKRGATSKKIRGIKSNKKYYVQLRTYKLIDEKIYISKALSTEAVTTNCPMVIPEEYEALLDLNGKTWNELDLNDDEYSGFCVALKNDVSEEYMQSVIEKIDNIGEPAKISYLYDNYIKVSSLDLISVVIDDLSAIDYIEPDYIMTIY